MSFPASESQVLNQQLRVQELVVTSREPQLSVVDSGDVVVLIGEKVARVVCALRIDDSGATVAPIVQADLIISDSSAYTAGGDAKAVRLNGVASLDAGDAVILKYIVE